ncbi:MAG: hypothetical protein ACOX7N_10615 [Lawsonibacter sp.]
MKRVKSLGRYQKGILLLMIAMVLVFTVLYPITIAREGFEYKDTILIPTQENGTMVYSGKIQGKLVRFTVYADKSVVFQYADETYGPYTAKEDPTAVPKDLEMREHMTGVELRCGQEVLFRGGVLENGASRFLFREDGSLENLHITVTAGNGEEMDQTGDPVASMQPSASTILNLMDGPELTHKGTWLAWFSGVFFCIITAISILFADELFRWNLAFRIRNVHAAEPSDLEIAGRYFTWTVLPILAMILFLMGLE